MPDWMATKIKREKKSSAKERVREERWTERKQNSIKKQYK